MEIDFTRRYIIVCQEHGWFSTTPDMESAVEFRDLHLHDEHSPETDVEILIAKEVA